MALPTEKLSNIYVIPRYDYTDPLKLPNVIVLSNLDDVDREITVKIGGVEMVGSSFTGAAKENLATNFPGVSGGPVVVSSEAGAKIIASLYELRRDPNYAGSNGQSEMLGIPWEELSDSYIIPRYPGAANPATLDARILIAVPKK